MVCGVVKIVDMDWFRRTMNFVYTERHVVHAVTSRCYSIKNNKVPEGVGGGHGRWTSTMQVRRLIPRQQDLGD
jgi:hypothetical protein